jgi:hypothetical protein
MMRTMIAGVRNALAAGPCRQIAHRDHSGSPLPSAIMMRTMIAGVRNALAAGPCRQKKHLHILQVRK